MQYVTNSLYFRCIKQKTPGNNCTIASQNKITNHENVSRDTIPHALRTIEQHAFSRQIDSLQIYQLKFL